MIRLAIIEDEPLIRQSLQDFFSGEPGFHVLLVAASVESFFEQWSDGLRFDIVLSDIGLPGQSGIQGIRRIKKRLPACDVMMLTIYNDNQRIFQSLSAGATGYLLKQTPLPKIKEAVKTLHEGGSPMSPAIARKVVEHFSPRKSTKDDEQLTPRENQIVRAVEEGLTNKEVALRLNITVETVKSHIKNIYQKLAITSRHELIRGSYKQS